MAAGKPRSVLGRNHKGDGPESGSALPTDALAAAEARIAEVNILGENHAVGPVAPAIVLDREKIADFCRARGIRRLSLFGSVLRPDFDPARSDVDVLAEFEPGTLKDAGFQYFGYGRELSAVLGRKVDFCSRLHPFIWERVKGTLLPVYERP